jgi:hypothetical protein
VRAEGAGLFLMAPSSSVQTGILVFLGIAWSDILKRKAECSQSRLQCVKATDLHR